MKFLMYSYTLVYFCLKKSPFNSAERHRRYSQQRGDLEGAFCREDSSIMI